MAKLHEILAAEKTPTGAWSILYEETLKKFKNPDQYFHGHSKSLKMIEESPGNAAIEAQAREERPVTTTVFDTLDYALGIFAKAEDLQYQKNLTNAKARGTVMWLGQVLLPDLPVDELLGLEARLGRIRQLFGDIPTLDASKHWKPADNMGENVFEVIHPEDRTKTEKMVMPFVKSPATDNHPAQVEIVTKDVVVGMFTTVSRTGAATAQQKAEAIKQIDELIVEVKQARMRANETEVETGSIAGKIVALLLEPLKN